ncbi:MAG: hypothetical protein KDA68_06260 [Planctomycetaceae bacterium]|nr:hypothetical protein [Planctomycetaceae bacterium]
MTDIVVDACCLINLVASGNILPTSTEMGKKSKKASFPGTLHVPEIVANEALYILQPDSDDPSALIKTPIDLSASREQRLLLDCNIEGIEESSLFVQLAVRLDDGEAASLAIAKNRSWTLATDDRVAATLAAELSVVVLNTPELVKLWADHVGANARQIHKTIHSIQTNAKFVPRQESREAEWWQRHSQRK